jgi:hypothetical protein
MTGTEERDLDLVRTSARELARRFDLGYWRQKDSHEEYPWEFVRAFADAGWLGAMIPEEYGGLGLGLTESAVMMCEVAASGAGMSGASAIHFYVFPPAPILRHGAAEMKRAWLPRLARGETLMAFGVTEPTAGSDTSRITTRAAKIDGGWLVNGQKVWTTNAQHAQRILLLARTAPRSDDKPLDGMTLFFTDLDRTRITVRATEKLGRAAVDSNELFIDDLEVPDEDVVGEPGQGFRYLLDGLNPERTVVGVEGGRHRPRRARPGHQVRKRARRLRPPDRQEPGDRAPARRRVDPAGGGGAHGHEGGRALRRRAAVRQEVERRQVPRRRGGLPLRLHLRARPAEVLLTGRLAHPGGFPRGPLDALAVGVPPGRLR